MLATVCGWYQGREEAAQVECEGPGSTSVDVFEHYRTTSQFRHSGVM